MGLFIYYVSMNNLWSLFEKMMKDDREGLRVIRKDDVRVNSSIKGSMKMVTTEKILQTMNS